MNDNILLQISKALDRANGRLSSVEKMIGTSKLAIEALRYRGSEKYYNERVKAKYYDKKVIKLLYFTMFLWVMIIIITIYLCVSGNDIILKFLHI